MNDFDRGGPPNRSVVEGPLFVALDVLLFPLTNLVGSSLPAALESPATEVQYAMLFANGMLWSGAVFLFWGHGVNARRTGLTKLNEDPTLTAGLRSAIRGLPREHPPQLSASFAKRRRQALGCIPIVGRGLMPRRTLALTTAPVSAVALESWHGPRTVPRKRPVARRPTSRTGVPLRGTRQRSQSDRKRERLYPWGCSRFRFRCRHSLGALVECFDISTHDSTSNNQPFVSSPKSLVPPGARHPQTDSPDRQ